MIELNEKAGIYAEKNVINVLKEAFAKVYADGYRDGYRDCKENVSVNLHFCNTEYVDLGLPSGTLWSADYEKEDDNILYLPYETARTYDIPTKEQWEELKKYARWDFQIDEEHNSLITIKCIGPNGNALLFDKTGEVEFAKKFLTDMAFFWIKDESVPNTTVRMWLYNHEGRECIDEEGPQIKTPLRLVKSK